MFSIVVMAALASGEAAPQQWQPQGQSVPYGSPGIQYGYGHGQGGNWMRSPGMSGGSYPIYPGQYYGGGRVIYMSSSSGGCTGGRPGSSSGSSGSPSGEGGDEKVKKELKELKKEVERLRKARSDQRLDELKRKLDGARRDKLEDELNALRRQLSDLRHRRPSPEAIPLPPPRAAGSAPQELPPPREDEGMVLLNVPAGAALYVNGKKVPLTRSYVTPRILDGKAHPYNFRVEVTEDGRTVARTQRVFVGPGEAVRLDYELMTPVEGGEAIRDPRQTRVTIWLPEKARLYVNGVPSRWSSAVRRFETSLLTPGRSYPYTFRAEIERGGKVITRTRTVNLRAGDQVMLDLGGTATSLAVNH